MPPINSSKIFIPGPAGRLEAIINDPGSHRKGIALIGHPHSLHGGTFENKVVSTLASTFYGLGYVSIRINFRSVGASEGEYDHGIGETEDMMATAEYARNQYGELPVVLAGFSFGAFVQTRVATQLEWERLILVGLAVSRFEVGDVDQKALLVHGEEDEVVPLQDLLNWARPKELPIVVLPGTTHFFHGKLHHLRRIVEQSCACANKEA